MKGTWIFNIETCEAYILGHVGNGLYSIENVEGRLETVTTIELLTQYFKTGLSL